MPIILRPYTLADFDFFWSTINSRIKWLASKGLEGQWGAEPWDSAVREHMRARLPEDASKGAHNWIAEVDGELAGFMQLTPLRAEHVPFPKSEDKPGDELYLRLFLVHPHFRGKAIGDFMLDFAQTFALEKKVDWLRLDCWKGPEGKDGLVKYYERKGFTRRREFVVPPQGSRPTEYSGQLMELKVVKVQ
ncbi:N-acetyltransferase GCN5 [Favolaschia claudopus]|uniref:N-acetyltransferase GCN5 n=1 Tax=Favolaschia claudopus TaxID=2862362 RepID=A0AAW0CJQ8_9AGAR